MWEATDRSRYLGHHLGGGHHVRTNPGLRLRGHWCSLGELAVSNPAASHGSGRFPQRCGPDVVTARSQDTPRARHAQRWQPTPEALVIAHDSSGMSPGAAESGALPGLHWAHALARHAPDLVLPGLDGPCRGHLSPTARRSVRSSGVMDALSAALETKRVGAT